MIGGFVGAVTGQGATQDIIARFGHGAAVHIFARERRHVEGHGTIGHRNVDMAPHPTALHIEQRRDDSERGRHAAADKVGYRKIAR